MVHADKGQKSFFTPQRDHRYIHIKGRNIPDQCDLYDQAHVAGWEAFDPDDLGHVSRVRSVIHRSCTAGWDLVQLSVYDLLTNDISAYILCRYDLSVCR